MFVTLATRTLTILEKVSIKMEIPHHLTQLLMMAMQLRDVGLTQLPREIREEAIPLASRILKVAEWYEWLLSQKFSVPDIISILEHGSGTAFDPAIVHAFTKALKEVEEV